MKKFFILAILFLFIGCAAQDGTMPVMPSACDTIQGPSMLCAMAAEQGVNLSMVADGLGLANIIAIERGMYSKEDALKVLTGLRQFMDGPVSYAAFRAELDGVVTAYPYLLNTLEQYTSRLIDTRIMYTEDANLIRGWLDRLIKGLG